MASKDLWTKLMMLDDAKAMSVVDATFDEYYKLLESIARDIYDSCIKDFYAKRKPRKLSPMLFL